MEHKCNFCNYTSNKLFNLKRHQSNKHLRELLEKEEHENNEKNVPPHEKKVTPNEKNVNTNDNIQTVKQNMCKKNNKSNKTKKSLIEHETRCTDLDD